MTQNASPPTTPSGNDVQGGKTAIIVAAVVSFCLSLLPFGIYRVVGWPLMLLSTFAHEMGHGITAVLIGGQFHSFVMDADGSGMASLSFAGGSRIAQAVTAAGGLVGPAVLGAALFRMTTTAQLSRIALYLLGAASALSVLLVVRNGFGIMYVSALAVTCLLIAQFAPERVTRLVIAFLAVQLAISVFTRSGYLFTEWAAPGAPSDVAQMAQALLLPYWFWGGCCAAFSAAVLFLGLRGVLRRGR